MRRHTRRSATIESSGSGQLRFAAILLVATVACSPTPLPQIDTNALDAGEVAIPRDAGVSVVADAGSSSKKDAGTVVHDAGVVDSSACAIDLEPQLAAIGVPGLAAGVLADGRLVCTAAAGAANIEGNRPVTDETIFAWASVSKTVTAVAMMILVDRGLASLDDDVDTHLGFRVDNPHCGGQSITIRQLMVHASSIIDATVYDTLYTTTGDSMIELGGFLQDYLITGGRYYDANDNYDYDCPGTYTEYSNVAVALLGHLVESISGVAFDDFCRREIFEPLEMGPASFFFSRLDPNAVAMPYVTSGSSFQANGHNGLPTYPDGSLRATVPGLARFLEMFVNGGTLDGVRILSDVSVAEMMRVQDASLDPAQGLIWFYGNFGAHSGLVGHDGSDPGTSAFMFFDPATKDGALLVANGDWYGPNDDASAAESLLGALFDEAARY